MYTPINPVTNPTDEERHRMLQDTLENAGRPEDYEYILKNLSPPPDITSIASSGDMRGIKIGVLGGGIAGMAAAFELRKLGADITILEASKDRIGGRIYTYYFDDDGKLYAEFGAMRVPVSHETSWHYMNLFHLDTETGTTPHYNNFLYVHNTRLRVTDSVEQYLYPKYELTPQERATPWGELIDFAFEYQIRKLPPEVRAQMLQILPEYSPEYQPLLNLSVRQYLEAIGLSQGAISLLTGTFPMTGALLDVSYSETLSEDYSMDFVNTYLIQGGFVKLPLAFYQSFQNAYPAQYSAIPPSLIGTAAYQPGSYVTGIYQSAYRDKVIVRYRHDGEAKDFAEVFDYVVCALPFSVLREVEIMPFFRNQKMQAIYEFNYADVQKTAFLCNRRFWERDASYGNILGGISFTDLPIQSIIYPSDHNYCPEDTLCSPEDPGILIASYNLNQQAVRVGNLEERRRYRLIRENVEEVHGLPRGFLNSIVDSSKTVDWYREPLFRGALTFALPGQKNSLSYAMTLPEYNNRVFFAGEHIASKHGWIQGSLYTGKAAANQIAYSYKKRP
ncbi:MAG: amine oxidase [Lachnospiraceae bacterium]|nr:amine oxidase [Lachnospiraceae bacterium]